MAKILRGYGRAVKFRLGRFVGVKMTSPWILNATAAARHSFEWGSGELLVERCP